MSDVTHEQLHAGQMALIDRFTEHERRFSDVSAKLFSKVDLAIDAAHENKVFLTQIQGEVSLITDRGVTQIARLDGVDLAVRALEKAHSQSIGERGVFAAILRSPFIAWFVGIAVSLWAVINHAGSIKP